MVTAEFEDLYKTLVIFSREQLNNPLQSGFHDPYYQQDKDTISGYWHYEIGGNSYFFQLTECEEPKNFMFYPPETKDGLFLAFWNDLKVFAIKGSMCHKEPYTTKAGTLKWKIYHERGSKGYLLEFEKSKQQ